VNALVTVIGVAHGSRARFATGGASSRVLLLSVALTSNSIPPFTTEKFCVTTSTASKK